MSINSVVSTGVHGVQLGIERANQAGERIARSGAENAEAVELRLGELQVKASAKVVEVGDSMLGSVIDIQA